jgi:hypothetical protein
MFLRDRAILWVKNGIEILFQLASVLVCVPYLLIFYFWKLTATKKVREPIFLLLFC